jgi:hypothetical protein
MDFIRWYLFIAPHVLLGVVLLIVLSKRLSKRFPLFTVYLVFEIAQFLMLLFVGLKFSTDDYRWALISTDGFGSLLKFGVVYGLTRGSVFTPSSITGVLRSWLMFVGAGCLLLGVIISAALSPAGHSRLFYAFNVLELSSSIVLTGLLLALFLFAHLFGLAWQSHGLGIALGFGISEGIQLVVSAIRPQLHGSAFIFVDNIGVAAYHVAVVIWLIYLIRPERVVQLSRDGLQEADIESWNRELRSMIQRRVARI